MQPLVQIGRKFGATVKIVEVPPGPPVLAPLVAEVYGLDYARQIKVAQQVRAVFEQTTDIVDIDDTIEAGQEKLVVEVDRARAAKLGVAQDSIVAAVATATRGADPSYLHSEGAQSPIPIRLELALGREGAMSMRFAPYGCARRAVPWCRWASWHACNARHATRPFITRTCCRLCM